QRQGLRIPQNAGDPLRRRDQLLGANATVTVGIDERQAACLDTEAHHRAGQRNPELLVELPEMSEVISGLDLYLFDAPCPEKPPFMRHAAPPLPVRGQAVAPFWVVGAVRERALLSAKITKLGGQFAGSCSPLWNAEGRPR